MHFGNGSIDAGFIKKIGIAILGLFVASMLVLGIIIVAGGVGVPSDLHRDGNTLRWSAVEGATGYVVNVDGDEFDVDGNSYSPKFDNAGYYGIKVRAIKGGDKSEWSSEFDWAVDTMAVAKNIVIEKEYDGSRLYTGELVKGVHYDLNVKADIDIEIVSAVFNSVDTGSGKVIVTYSGKLKGADADKYPISAGSFEIGARINAKHIEVTVESFGKQFGDRDNMSGSFNDTVLGKVVEFNYVRQSGESVGKYDILGAVSLNNNYIVDIGDNSGDGKYEIVKRVVDIVATKDAYISKVYDGVVAFNGLSNIPKDKLYVINNVVSGYSVDITPTSANFDSADVISAEHVVVGYSGVLVDPNGVYTTIKSSFEVDGSISPKKASVVPNVYRKEFGDSDLLSQEFYDIELDTRQSILLIRDAGESIGIYDITDVAKSNPNYDFGIVAGSGKEKFEITKRIIKVVAQSVGVAKEYDGTSVYSGKLVNGIHYVLDRELDNYPVDIIITSTVLDNATIKASKLVVSYSDTLQDTSNVYKLVGGEFDIPAKVTPRQVIIEPDKIIRQYGDSDDLSTTYYDSTTSTIIDVTYTRTAGDSVGMYDITAIVSGNENYEFDVFNGKGKYEITKRDITVSATSESVTKVFDNTTDYYGTLTLNTHYKINNLVGNDSVDIVYIRSFNASDITSNSLIVNIISLTQFDDRYNLITDSIKISATITPKLVDIEPDTFTVQYGDPEYLRQSYSDTVLGFTFNVTFGRVSGNQVGSYDIISAMSDNPNYSFTVVKGDGKYNIEPRKLQVDIVAGAVFTKVYDGTRGMSLPITQGVHYNLNNLVGGTEASLNIISKEYDTKDVVTASKVIVKYSAVLSGADGSQYYTVGGTMEFDARITLLKAEVTPQYFKKGYLEDLELRQDVLIALSGDTLSVTYTSSAGASHKNAEVGIYDLIDIQCTDTNHMLVIASGTGVGKFEIYRVDLEIIATNRSTVYNSTGQGISDPYSNPVRTLTVLYKLSTDGNDKYSATLPINAGTYTAKISFAGDHNYLPQDITRTLTIDRADSIIVDTTPKDYVYDGTIKLLIATLNHSEAQLVYSRNDYINAGTYNYITISVAQTTNYRATSITVSLTISKQVLQNNDIKYPTASSITYGDYLYTAILSGGSTLGYFEWVDGNIKPKVADKAFEVKLSPYDTDNYDWDNVDMARSVSITVSKFVVNNLVYPTASGVVHTFALSTATLTGVSEYGSFAWQDSTIIPSASGNYTVVFTPYDTENYDYSHVNMTQGVFVEVSYRTTFETNGGSSVSQMVVQQIQTEPFTFKDGYIFDGWFYDEMLINKVAFPLNITKDSILYAGWHSEGLIFTLKNNTYSVRLDALTAASQIFIPKEYKGLPVTAIENDGFRNNTALEIVVIPSTVISIGHRAFMGCVNLWVIEIINTIDKIDFGQDWNATGFIYGTDIHLEADECPDCDGTLDFHQPDCPRATRGISDCQRITYTQLHYLNYLENYSKKQPTTNVLVLDIGKLSIYLDVQIQLAKAVYDSLFNMNETLNHITYIHNKNTYKATPKTSVQQEIHDKNIIIWTTDKSKIETIIIKRSLL